MTCLQNRIWFPTNSYYFDGQKLFKYAFNINEFNENENKNGDLNEVKIGTYLKSLKSAALAKLEVQLLIPAIPDYQLSAKSE